MTANTNRRYRLSGVRCAVVHSIDAPSGPKYSSLAPDEKFRLMLLYRLNNLSLAFGDQPLLDKVALTIHKGQRIGILGQNGAGKSTFMKVLLGTVQPDSGDLWRADGMKVAYLDQTLPPLADQTIYDYIASGLEGLGDLLRQY